MLDVSSRVPFQDDPLPAAQEWLEQVARELVTVSGAIGSVLWLWDETVQALQAAASCRMSPEYLAYGNQVATVPEAKSKAPIYLSYKTGVTIELEGAKSDPEYAYFLEGFQDYPIGYVYTAPIGLMHRRLGAIGLYYAEPVKLTESQALRVQLIGTQVAGLRMQHDMRDQLGNKIRELEGANAYLTQANREMKQLDRLKGNFMSAVSHELRTPLTSIMGFAELLEDEIGGPLSETQREFVQRVQGASSDLLDIVDNVLDFMRLEAGTFQLTPQQADVVEVVKRVLPGFSHDLCSKGLTLTTRFPDESLIARVDTRRLHQVVKNLLSNAIKFTPGEGALTLTLARQGDMARFEMSDTGIGIAPEHLPRLFDKFYQADPGLTRTYGGVGLGLAVVKATVEAHEGAIAVDSQPGRGSTFIVTLPLAGPALDEG
jgi:signal transduction histidine kinase